jgi:tetratricopeptide (TPR) repeat protein
MNTILRIIVGAAAALVGTALAQAPAGNLPKEPPHAEAAAAKAARPKAQISDGARAALASAKELAGRLKGLQGNERTAAAQAAAMAYDKVAADFAAEPQAAAQAAFAAADLWRRHGSLPLAEKDYLQAAQLDAKHFGQRALLEAADMQRRQKQTEKAIATYAQVVTLEAGGSRAQEARLWQGRLLQSLGRLDEAVSAFQVALEAAQRPRQVIEACNFLACACMQKGDLDAAERAIEHADQAVQAAGEDDPIEVERLRKALEGMSSRKALQRARDKQTEAGKDARALDERRAGEVGGGKQ